MCIPSLNVQPPKVDDNTVVHPAETNDNGAHRAEVGKWSHFIPEGMTVKPGQCFPFPRYIPLMTSLLMGALCCAGKHQLLCVCVNSKLACLTDLHVGELETHEGLYKNKENQQQDVPVFFYKFWEKNPNQSLQSRWMTLAATNRLSLHL